MQVRELKVSGAFEITLHRFPDERGSFLEWFQQSAVEEAVGHKLDLAQANCSVSARGVLRGIHFSDVPPGQAKYVTCGCPKRRFATYLLALVKVPQGCASVGSLRGRPRIRP